MDIISPENSRLLLDRFYEFSDGLLRSFIVWRVAAMETCARLEISARDVHAASDWVNIVLDFANVQEFRFNLPPSADCWVISNGAQLTWVEDVLYFDLLPYSTSPRDLADVRASELYLAAKIVRWDVTSYRETAPFAFGPIGG